MSTESQIAEALDAIAEAHHNDPQRQVEALLRAMFESRYFRMTGLDLLSRLASDEPLPPYWHRAAAEVIDQHQWKGRNAA